MSEWILTLLIATPLLGAVAVGLSRVNGAGEQVVRRVRGMALGYSVLTLALAIYALVLFFQAGTPDHRAADRGDYALIAKWSWVSDSTNGGGRGYVDLQYNVGVDGLSIWLLMLTAFITPLSIWASYTAIRDRVREYYVLMLLLEAGMLGVFCARDLLLFYVFFEFTLVPLFFLIGIWGGPERHRAAVKFFIYTVAGSVLTFAGVLYLSYKAYALTGTVGGGSFTFDLETLYRLRLSPAEQRWLFLAFAAGFAIKVPLFPFHTWLPLAHTEAPTAGSVLLAGVLLKLGTYGFLRFSLPMLPVAAMECAPVLGLLAVVGIIYGALVAWIQEDFKKLIAYSSVSHLGFCILGMFSMKTAGVTGSLLYMVNHGLSTGALFLVVGMIYERYHTREFSKIGGLARPMPWMAFFLVVFTLSSIGLPGMNGFVSEFLVLVGTFTSASRMPGESLIGPFGILHAALAALGIILSAIYMLHMCGRILFGPLKQPENTPDLSSGLSRDLSAREISILTPIAICCLVLGVCPNLVIDSVQPAAVTAVLKRVAMGTSDRYTDDDAQLVDAESGPWTSPTEIQSVPLEGVH